MDLKEKHVFITGAGKRLGRAIAEKLIPSKIRLTAHYRRSRAEAEALAALGKSAGSQVHLVSADLSDPNAMKSAAAQAMTKFGPVDILINCASDFFPTPALDCTEAEWDRLLNTNLRGQFFLSQACAKEMIKRGGLILNLADVNGERPMKGYTPYVCSKAGLLMMTRNLAKEWAPSIRVNAISPGPVLLPETYTAEQRQRSSDRTLLKRLGSPADIAEAAAFLIANDYVTGMNLVVDGGRSLS